MDLGNCSIINKGKKKQDLRYRGFPQEHLKSLMAKFPVTFTVKQTTTKTSESREMPQKAKYLSPKHEALSSFSAPKKSSLQRSTPVTLTPVRQRQGDAC